MMPIVKVFSVLLILLLFIGCTEDTPVTTAPESFVDSESEMDSFSKGFQGRKAIRAMTYNIYIGANVDIVLTATSFDELIVEVAAAYDTLHQTNFPERADAIAKLIRKYRPHFIGLQEVSLIQRFDQIPPTTLYEELNFLEILMNALAAKGMNYQVAESIQNADVTLPRLAGIGPGGVPVIDFVRVVDSDVILVRNGVQISNPIKGNYSIFLQIPNPVNPQGPTIDIQRGFVSVEAKVGKRSYRFINTHLEPFVEQIRLAQVQQLTTVFSGETLPTIMVGDFNTLDPMPPNPYMDATYNFLTNIAGYTDTWVHNWLPFQGAGYTSPFSAALRDPYPNLFQRIDFIFANNFEQPIGPVLAVVIGTRFRDRTPSGLWPSDHAGVVAKLHLRQMSNTPINIANLSASQD